MLDDRSVEGRSGAAALDRLLGGSWLPTPASPAVDTDAVLDDFGLLLRDPPLAKPAFEWLQDNHLLSPEALAACEKLGVIWENQFRAWDRGPGSGSLDDSVETAKVIAKTLVFDHGAFGLAFYDAAYTAFASQIVDTWEYLAGVARWALQMSECRFAVQLSGIRALAMEDWAELELDPIACGWVHDFIESTRRTLDSAALVWEESTAWGDVIAEQPSILLDGVIVYQECVLEILDVVLQDRTFHEYLRAKAAEGAVALAVLSGTITGFVAFEALWMVAGAGAGSVGRVGKILWELAELPLPSLPSEKPDENEARFAQAAVGTRPRGGKALATDEIRERMIKNLKLLGDEGVELVEAVVKAVRKAQRKLTRKISDPRLQAILKAMRENRALLQALPVLRRAVRSGLDDAFYTFGPHKDMTKWVAHVNQGVNALAYLEVVVEVLRAEDLDTAANRPIPRRGLNPADAAMKSFEMIGSSVESAHAIDARLWEHIKPIFNKAGIPWETSDDIFAMLLPNEIHTTNALRATARAVGLEKLDGEGEYMSLTGTLKTRIQWGKRPKDAPKGVHFMDETWSAERIIKTFEEVTHDWAKGYGAKDRFFKQQKRMYTSIRRLMK